MKKLVFTAAIAVLGFTSVNAQDEMTTIGGFEEGDVFVEGNFGFGSTNDKNTEFKTSSFDFNPKVGYLISDDLAVGVQLMVGSDKEETTVAGTTTETKASNFGAGVFARYYFLELGKRFQTYGEFGVGFDSAKFDDGVDATDDLKSNGLGAGLGLGMNYFVTENLAINFGLSDILSYGSVKADVDGAEAVSSFNGNLNVFNNFFQTAQFGATWKF